MSGLTMDIKKMFNFKYKSRDDSITDQYNRLYMMKVMLVAAFLTGLSWYNDTMKCIVPKGHDSSTVGKYGPKSCWITGFYVYENMRDLKDFEGYFAIPTLLSNNGTRIKDKSLCVASHGAKSCKPMKKKFYLQFQWFPFYLAVMACLFYIPYLLFLACNDDLASLKKAIKKENANLDDIVKTYFKGSTNLQRQMLRLIGNVAVKIAYIMANVLVLVITNSLLNGDYMSFGSKWLDWSEKPNSVAYDYLGIRTFARPGEYLLPTFGLCDVFETGLDKVNHLVNAHTIVCEISQHILYHYVLMAMWFLLIIGIVISVVGLFAHIIKYFVRSITFSRGETSAKEVFSGLSIREAEYLDFIHKKNYVYYGQILRKLKESMDDSDTSSEPTAL